MTAGAALHARRAARRPRAPGPLARDLGPTAPDYRDAAAGRAQGAQLAVWSPALHSPIPLRRGQSTIVGAPMCDPWGFLHLKLGLRLGSRLVVRRRLDPHATLREVAQHQATALVVVPEMLQRIMVLGKDAIAGYETTSLQLIAINGFSLPQELAMPAMETFGDVLYNLDGPTVVRLHGILGSHDRVPGGPEPGVGEPSPSAAASGNYAACRGRRR